jgi:predicted nucleic acid-binding protein
MSRFFDTNILVYAQEASPKGDIARLLMEQGGTISIQVLNEFASVMKRKYSRTWAEIEAALQDVETVLEDIRPITLAHHHKAITLARDHTLSFYDALIIAAALDAECDVLFSEDLQHGREFGALEVVNPFG